MRGLSKSRSAIVGKYSPAGTWHTQREITDKGAMMIKFTVIDKITGKPALTWKITKQEVWAGGLSTVGDCMFALLDNGELILCAKDCLLYVVCPPDRFEVVIEGDTPVLVTPLEDLPDDVFCPGA